MKRIESKGMISGVCAGISYDLRLPVFWVRLAAALFISQVFWLYILVWLITTDVDEVPHDYDEVTG